MEQKLSLSVVIPTYNEQERLGATLSRLTTLAPDFRSLEVIVSDDGSNDNTLQIAESWRDAFDLRLLRNPHLGPGEAIRRGVLASSHPWVLLSDADGPVAFETVHAMLEFTQVHELDVLSGRRVGPDARIAPPPPFHRQLMGHLWRQFVRFGLGTPFRDPQCGFKVFRGDSARRLFALTTSQSFGIHVETMMMAASMGLLVDEYPVNWGDRDGSKIRPIRDSVAMLREAIYARRKADIYRSHSSQASRATIL